MTLSSAMYSKKYKKIRRDVVFRDFLTDLIFFIQENDKALSTNEVKAAYPNNSVSDTWIPLSVRELCDETNYGKKFKWNASAIMWGPHQKTDWTISMTEVEALLTFNHFMVGDRYIKNKKDYPMINFEIRGKKWGTIKFRIMLFPDTYMARSKIEAGDEIIHSMAAAVQLFRDDNMIGTVRVKSIHEKLPEGKTLENAQIWELLPAWLEKAQDAVDKFEIDRRRKREWARKANPSRSVRKGGYLKVNDGVNRPDLLEGGEDMPRAEEVFDINEEG